MTLRQKKFHRHRLRLLSIFTLCITVACSGSTSLSDDAINFKNQTLKDLLALEAVVRPGLSQNHTAQFIDNAIKAFFNTIIDRKKHGGCTVAVLDKDMQLITGRVLQESSSQGDGIDPALRDYNYLKSEFKGIELNQIVQTILYYRQNRIYVVSKSVNKDVEIVGFIFVAYHADGFEKQWGISAEEFMKIDFNS